MRRISIVLICFMAFAMLASCNGTSFKLDPKNSDLSPKITISELNKSSSSAEIILTVVFASAVTEFDESDLVFEGGVIQSFSGSGKIYNFKILTSTNVFSVQILSGAAMTSGGKSTTASNVATYAFTEETKVYGSCFEVATLQSQYLPIGM
jgi:hypothetical protein